MHLNHCHLLLSTVAIYLGAALPIAAQDSASPGAVVVTGAPSGIGRKITERLAARGYWVYAGARTQPEMDELNAIKNVQAVRLDVTSPADIAAAVALVQRGNRPLRGIVNNAGVVGVAPLIEMSEQELSFVLNVNLFGPFRVTKAFAPLLLNTEGRVVNISSLNGVVASPMIGAYSMSKHGIEAYSDALGAELAQFGVKVSVIEPGNYGTSIGRNMLARTDTSLVNGSRFERQWRSALGAMASFDRGPPPDAVADAVLDALSSANPKPRYLVVPVPIQATIVMRKLMQTIAELNADQPYSVDRDTLVKMLDEALARARGGERPRTPE
jgi:NAD(P)-dependent dehydrogenase (short-subunit alcohol dehydrogenase family)